MSTVGDENEIMLLSGSDEHRAHNCSACSKDGRTVSASSYCKDCSNVLCSDCLTQHNRFGAMALHEVVTISDDVDARLFEPDNAYLPSLQCSLHKGKLLELYCGNHDDVICIICKAMNHSTCMQTSYLPSVIEEIYKERDFTEAMSMIKEVKARLTHQEEKGLSQKEEIIVKKNDMKKQLDDEKQLIKEHVDSLESPLLEEIETMTKQIMDSNESRTKTIETTIQGLEKSEKALMARGKNLSDSFIKLKQTQKQIEQAEKLQIDTQQKVISNIHFRPNKKLSKKLKGIDSLGTLVHGSKENLYNKFVSCKEVKVIADDDEFVPDISGACVLTDGHVVIVDCKNMSLKKLNERYQLSGDTLKLLSTPWSACTVNSTTIAVSMFDARSVFLVWVKGKMDVCTSFNVSDNCSGICHNDEKLYVCVGGMGIGTKGAVEVYTLSGIRLNVLTRNICCPRGVTVLDETVFVADEENVLIEIENDHTKIHSCKDVMESQSICLSSDGNLLICGMDSNNIFSFSTEENVFTEILSETIGLSKPQLLCFGSKKSDLLVGLENCEVIKVYTFVN